MKTPDFSDLTWDDLYKAHLEKRILERKDGIFFVYKHFTDYRINSGDHIESLMILTVKEDHGDHIIVNSEDPYYLISRKVGSPNFPITRREDHGDASSQVVEH